MSKEEEARMCKSWRKTLIIKLLQRKIEYRVLEPRLYKMGAKDDILDIINLTHDYFMVKFSAFSDYEYAFISGLLVNL